jgi:alkylated DNA nucleotide flippase Atl1
MDWQQLLAVLQQQVAAGQVTTYGECSQWAFGHRSGGKSIRAMLEAAARRGNQLWTNRVVFDDGAFGAADAAHGQSAQLQAEGVAFDGQRVDLVQCPPVVL